MILTTISTFLVLAGIAKSTVTATENGHFFVKTGSEGNSKIAWRLFEEDNDPLIQDTGEKSVRFIPVDDYNDQKYIIPSEKMEYGGKYCLRTYKGSEEAYGSNGSNLVELYWNDGMRDMKVTTVSVESTGLQVKCFTAREDVLEKFPPITVSCRRGSSAAEKIHLLAAIGPLDSWTTKQISDEAWDVSKKSNLPNKDDGKQDAFRHCYFSCRLTQEIGLEQALEAGDIHESCFFHGSDSKNMDLRNNRVGAIIGDQSNGNSECDSGCKTAIETDDLVWLARRRNLRGAQD
eukprot:scaffold87397_cov70-Cyclotella_meneghiniana.AAC.12